MRLRWPIEDVVAYAKRYALTHGLLCLVSDNADQATFVPFSLYPSPYSYSHFKFIWSIQTAYNRLYNRISLDDATLEAALASVIPMDAFVARLWQIHHTSPRRQNIQLDIYRSESSFHRNPRLYFSLFRRLHARHESESNASSGIQHDQFSVRRSHRNRCRSPSGCPSVRHRRQPHP